MAVVWITWRNNHVIRFPLPPLSLLSLRPPIVWDQTKPDLNKTKGEVW
jgi:hypothetical protein